MTQFQKVNSTRGAPMGRSEYGTLPQEWPRTVRLFRVKLDSGGYDDGGAYWGTRPSDEALYCATDDKDFRKFTSAGSRLRAALQMELPAEHLLAVPKKQAERFMVATAPADKHTSEVTCLRRAILRLGYAKEIT